VLMSVKEEETSFSSARKKGGSDPCLRHLLKAGKKKRLLTSTEWEKKGRLSLWRGEKRHPQ